MCGTQAPINAVSALGNTIQVTRETLAIFGANPQNHSRQVPAIIARPQPIASTHRSQAGGKLLPQSSQQNATAVHKTPLNIPIRASSSVNSTSPPIPRNS